MDNSTSTNYKLVKRIQGLDKVKYISMNGNKGLPIPLNSALKLSIDSGYDFLLTMDQDTKFMDGDIDKFIEKVERIYRDNLSDKKIAIYAADTSNRKADKELEYVNLVMTSGNLLDLKYMKKIGLFDENLFIDWVDQDLCYRVKSQGYFILQFNSIRLDHNLGEKETVKIGFLKKEITTHNWLRYYYMTRNKFYVLKKHNISNLVRFRFLGGSICLLAKIVLFETDRVNKVKAVFKGYCDYLTAKMGEYSTK